MTDQTNFAKFSFRKEEAIKRKYFLIKLAILGAAITLLVLTISYITFYAIKRNKKSYKAATFEKQVMDNVSPRPFLNDLRGELPTGFALSITTTTEGNFNGIDIPIPNNEPVQQLQPQSKPQPNNIQDIIQYITENAHRHKELPLQNYNAPQVVPQVHLNPISPVSPVTKIPLTPKSMFKLFGTVQGHHPIIKEPPPSSLGSISSLNSGPRYPLRFSQDIFFPYKPQELSDINLLAPNSFRFAPNSMLTVSKFKPLQVAESMYHSTNEGPSIKPYNIIKEANLNKPNIQETGLIRPVIKEANLTKPISLTLNVYPWMDDGWTDEKPPRFQGPGLTPRYRYRVKNHRSKLRKPHPEKMVLHLNIYPGANGVFSQKQEITVM